MKRYLDLTQLEALIDEIKTRFVQKVSGKDLSENDFTNLLKEKIEGVETGANVNKIEVIKKNGANISIGAGKSVDITVPTKLSAFTNDQEYQTKTQIQSLISASGKFKWEVVAVLPAVATADTNVMYLVPNDSGTGHIEWLAVNGVWEMIGDTGEIDLSGYLKETDMVPITNAEIVNRFNL